METDEKRKTFFLRDQAELNCYTRRSKVRKQTLRCRDSKTDEGQIYLQAHWFDSLQPVQEDTWKMQQRVKNLWELPEATASLRIRSSSLQVTELPERCWPRSASPRRRGAGSWFPAPHRTVWLHQLLLPRSTPWSLCWSHTEVCWSLLPSGGENTSQHL